MSSNIQPLSEVEPFDYFAQNEEENILDDFPPQPSDEKIDIGTYIEIGRAYNQERRRTGNADLDFNEFKAQYLRENVSEFSGTHTTTGKTDLSPDSLFYEFDDFFSEGVHQTYDASGRRVLDAGEPEDDFLAYQRSVMESDDEGWKRRYLTMQAEMAEQREHVNRRRMHGNPFLHEERALNIDLDRELMKQNARIDELRQYDEAADYFDREPEFDETEYMREREDDYPW